jgi:hypothetical protein
MLESKTRMVLVGVAAIAAGVTFGWALAGMPSRIVLPTTMLASSALITTAAIADAGRVEPARDPVAPAPAVVADAPAPAVIPAAAPAPAAPADAKPKGHMVVTGADVRVRKKRYGYRLDRPSTKVSVDPDRGKVRVRAPYANVRVDSDRGRVRVRAPYVNLGIGW